MCTVRTLRHGKLEIYSLSTVVLSWLNVHYQPVSGDSDMIGSVICFIGD